MAKTQQERDQALALRRQKAAETELRHRVRPGITAMLAELMQWHDLDEKSEAIQLLIMNAHAAGPIGSAPMLAIPRHDFTHPKTWRASSTPRANAKPGGWISRGCNPSAADQMAVN